jgi:hypothetical protein
MGNTAILMNEKFLESIRSSINITYEQVCFGCPHIITMVLAAVNTLKEHMEATWYITAVLGSHTPYGRYWTKN